MKYGDFLNFLQNIGKDPSRLIFEDELTGLYNRRFLLNYFEYKVSWDALTQHPLSLVMMDVDHFKQVNDRFGHQVGDQALIWVASLLKEIGSEQNLPIRYAGDEFMVLVLEGEKGVALEIGERLRQLVHEKAFRLPDTDAQETPLEITFSVGVASAPEDAATGKGLIQKADTALYFAKNEGRNRVADAREIPLQTVSAKTALLQLEGEKMAGRQPQTAQVVDSINKLIAGQNHFLIVEGAPGMGKTTFLEAIQRSLIHHKIIQQVKVAGDRQEITHPYFLVTQVLAELLNQLEDRGSKIFATLSPQESNSLATILPQLEQNGDSQPPLDEQKRREGLFNTLLYFIPRAVESHPFVLFVDDLDCADEASLLILRQLVLRRQFPFLLCGTSRELGRIQFEEKSNPLASFCEAHRNELNILRIQLTPLTAGDIHEHLQGVFPKASIPLHLAQSLEHVTEGSPLFLGEILRQLVLDQKIKLVGQQWMIEPMDPEVLPRSLEAMIEQKIAALDPESRHILERASALGENVSLSLLTGVAEKTEAKVLEFVEQATALGLLRSDFRWNDETIRFLSKRVQEITENALQPEEKKSLHEQIGKYQETLYERRLLSSPAPLIYHYRRAVNQEKAQAYEQFQAIQNNRIFNPNEALHYSGERRSELPPPGAPLDPASLAHVPSLIRLLLTALRNIRLYPQGSESVVSANRQLKEGIDLILEKNESLTIFQVRQSLMINGQRMDVSELKHVVEELFKLLNRVELQGMIFHQGLTEREIEVGVEALGQVKPKMIDKDYWRRFASEHELTHIELKQVRYTLMVEHDGQAGGRPLVHRGTPAPPREISYQSLAAGQNLEQEDWNQVPEIVRALLNAAKNIKLYPIHSKTITTAIDQLLDALRRVLLSHSALTLARVSHTLVVNGQKIETAGIETLVDSFLKFLDSMSLQSITFLEKISGGELKTFIEALHQPPPGGSGGEFWVAFTKEQGISGILLNQVLYESRVTTSPTFQAVEDQGAEGEMEEIEPLAEDLFDAFLKDLPGRVNECFLETRETELKQLLKRLFSRFPERSSLSREKTVEGCGKVLEDLTPAFQHRFAQLLADPLLGPFAEEKDPKILRDLASLLHRLAIHLIHFADYPLASRVLLRLRQRYQQLIDTKEAYAQRLAKILDRKLDPAIQKILLDDLVAGETAREERAALLLGSLGRTSAPLLIELVKKVGELRIREMAANLLKEMGPEAADLLKRELVLANSVEEKIRVLEVIDTVTRDLRMELVFVLQDESAKMREAGFRLLERLNNSQAAELLLDYARNQGWELAAQAIQSLGRLKPALAVEPLTSLLKENKDKKLLLACCRSLGQLADPLAIESLAKILANKRSIFSRKKRTAELRAAAAFALGQISHPRVAQILAPFIKDREPRVREIARLRMASAKPSPELRQSPQTKPQP